MRTKEECLKVETSLVLDLNSLVKGIKSNEVVEKWFSGKQRDGSYITLQLKLNGYEKWLKVLYQSANENDIDGVAEYYVIIEAVPSNLRKGENLYFICPVTGKRCKKLYLAGNSLVFKHRTAYAPGLYYASQYLSKNDRIDFRLQCIDVYIKQEKEKPSKRHYKGVPTKNRQRIERLELRAAIFTYCRIINIDRSIARNAKHL